MHRCRASDVYSAQYYSSAPTHAGGYCQMTATNDLRESSRAALFRQAYMVALRAVRMAVGNAWCKPVRAARIV